MALGAILTVIQFAPVVLKLIGEVAEAVEALGGPKTGDVKKASLMEAVDAAFDVQEQVAPGALGLDKAQFNELAGRLLETALTLQKARAEQAKVEP